MVFQMSSTEVATFVCHLQRVAVRMKSIAWLHQLSPPVLWGFLPRVTFGSPEARRTHPGLNAIATS